jgi:hypothetical protein
MKFLVKNHLVPVREAAEAHFKFVIREIVTKTGRYPFCK